MAISKDPKIVNSELIIRWRDLASKGDVESMYNLGAVYLKGLNGVKENHDLAVMYYKMAADLNYAPAQSRLGFCYWSGSGVPQSYEEAYEWYKRSADQNCAMGIYNLAVLYDCGMGVSVDKEKAFSMYKQAAELGDPDAQYNLHICYEDYIYNDINPEKAHYWLEKAAFNGSSVAQCYYAIAFLNRDASEENIEKAKEWLKKSIDNGYQYAKNVLNSLQSKDDGDDDDENTEEQPLFIEKTSPSGQYLSVAKVSPDSTNFYIFKIVSDVAVFIDSIFIRKEFGEDMTPHNFVISWDENSTLTTLVVDNECWGVFDLKSMRKMYLSITPYGRLVKVPDKYLNGIPPHEGDEIIPHSNK